MKRISLILATLALTAVAATAQTSVSVNAGTHGLNFNVSHYNDGGMCMMPVFCAPPPPPRPHYHAVPVTYYPDYGCNYWYGKDYYKAQKKAHKKYVKAQKKAHKKAIKRAEKRHKRHHRH